MPEFSINYSIDSSVILVSLVFLQYFPILVQVVSDHLSHTSGVKRGYPSRQSAAFRRHSHGGVPAGMFAPRL